MSPRYNGGRLGEMLLGRDVTFGQGLALHHLGQTFVIVIPCWGIIATLFINAHKAVKQNNLTVGAQNNLLIWAGDINGGAFQFCGRHLTGNRPFPNQII